MQENFQVGEYTYGFHPGSILWDIEAWLDEDTQIQPKLFVGKFCSIGKDPIFYLGGNHRHDWISTYPFHAGWVHKYTFTSNDVPPPGFPATNGNICIGNDVWIGNNVTIMSGVTIGDGAVLATNSTVVKDVEPYSIVGGNPARHLKYRFQNEIIEKLLELRWWDMSPEKINQIAPLLTSKNVEDLCKIFSHNL